MSGTGLGTHGEVRLTLEEVRWTLGEVRDGSEDPRAGL